MSRDLSLDILRGIMLIIMAADHFGEPVFQHLYEFAGYVSAAEGFVFLSGMLVALVYSRYHVAGGYVLEKRIWHRTGVIYLYHLSVLLAVFVFTVGTELSGAYWKSFAVEMQAEPIRAFLSGMTLMYQAPMLDVLPLYVSLMLVAPFALRLMLQYRGIGVAMVLAASGGLWLAAQFGLRATLLPWLPDVLLVRMGAFDLLGWQLIFVLGMVLGYLRFDSKGTAPHLHGGLLALSIGLIIYLFLQRHGHVNWDNSVVAWLKEYRHIGRDSMAWMRLLNFLAFVYLTAGLIAWHKHYGIFNWLAWPGRWLAFLGQHSLQVFSFHMVVLYCYIPFRWGEWAFTNDQKWFVLATFLASLTLPAWLHQQYQKAQKARRQNLKPLCNATMPPVMLV